MFDVLSTLLAQNKIKSTDYDKVRWFAQIMKWLQRPRSPEEKSLRADSVYTVRLKYLLMMLERNPAWKSHFVETVSELFLNASSTTQFSKIGFASHGFMQELLHRLQEKLLPQYSLTDDMTGFLIRVFPDETESIYVDFIEEEVLGELIRLFSQQHKLHERVKTDILSASYLLSVQLMNSTCLIRSDLGYADRDLTRFHEFALIGYIQKLHENNLHEANETAFQHLDKIEKNLEELYSSMSQQGVKIELVYQFQMQRRRLQRLRILLTFLNPAAKVARNFRLFVSHLILDAAHQRSFKSFFNENLSLLTERIVQSNSRIGEHYVAFNSAEVRSMFRSALGGGVVTSGTVFLKILIGKIGLTGFIKGFVDSLNYSASFLFIQHMGWTLATKQPSATAPFLASALSKSASEARRSIVALLRTQIIAVIGNLSLVFPICLFTSWLAHRTGHSVLGSGEALYILNSTNITGPTVIFAIFTGFLLFLASITAGWVENWVIVSKLAKRIEFSEAWRKVFGARITIRFARLLEDNSNALAASVILGFFLGLVPPYIKFMGLGLDVRHVTLSTGAFAASLPVVWQTGVTTWQIINPILGIMAIGVLNLSVSFTCAFLLASLSSKVQWSSFVVILKSGLKLIALKPWLLVVPEKEKAE